MLTLTQMAGRLGVPAKTVKIWHHAGLITGHPYNDKGQCLYPPPGHNPPTRAQGRKLSERRPARPPLPQTTREPAGNVRPHRYFPTTTTTQHPASTRRGAVCNPRFRLRRPGRRPDHPRAVTGEDVVGCRGELAVPVADEEPEPPGPIAEVHEQVPGLLGGPGPCRMGAHVQDVRRPGLDLHHEQHVKSAGAARCLHAGSHTPGCRMPGL